MAVPAVSLPSPAARSPAGFWRRYRRNLPAVGGLAAVTLVVLAGLFADLLRPGDPWTVAGDPFLWPGQDPRFPLGTDVLGRDVLSGILHGARVSLLVGLSATALAAGVGTLVGALSGYYGGLLDDVLMRITEAFQTIPSLLMAIIILALFTPSLATLVAAISVVSWPNFARLVRGETLRVKTGDFVAACRSFGMSDARIIVTQILPNCMAPLIVAVSVMIAGAILVEAGLSFLGLGDPARMSWGTMIAIGRSAMRSAWYLSAIPGLAILVTVMGINLIGDGLNDALNPSLRERA